MYSGTSPSETSEARFRPADGRVIEGAAGRFGIPNMSSGRGGGIALAVRAGLS